MTYESFADRDKWESSYSKDKQEMYIKRTISNFTIEMWRADNDKKWRWTATKTEQQSAVDRSLYSPQAHMSLDVSLSDCYKELTTKGWMSRLQTT